MHCITLWLYCNSDFFGSYENIEAQSRGRIVQPTMEYCLMPRHFAEARALSGEMSTRLGPWNSGQVAVSPAT